MGVVLLGCGIFAAGAAEGQKSEAPPAGAPLLLNVQVTDKAGHPVKGLQQSDFTLYDDGKPAPMELFRELSGSEPGVASIVVLIDDINADFNQTTFARHEIAKFLRGYGAGLPAPVAINLLTWSRVQPLLPASRDGSQLAAALEQGSAHFRPVPESDQYGQYERWQYSTEALEKIIRQQGAEPGRTLLVWVGPGWSLFDSPAAVMFSGQQTFWMKMVVGLSMGLVENRVTLDAVDPLGGVDGADLLATRWRGYLKPVKTASDAYWADLALQVLATNSGGRVLYASNDAAAELAQCAEDASDFYAIRFRRATSDKPDVWHSLEVKVDRPGMLVRTNQGYYAHP